MATIKRTDIAEKDLFKNIKTSAESTLQTLDQMDARLKAIAKNVKKSIGAKVDAKTSADLREFNNLVKQSTTLQIEAEKIQREKIKTAKIQAQADEQLRKIAERNTKAVKTETDAYKLLAKQTRDLKNESKRLGAELLSLEQAGKKN